MKNTRFLMILVALLAMAARSIGLKSQAPAATANSAPQLVILDTDIGDDLDDAFALGLVLRSPELELLGVTTAFGDTDLRARLVDRFLNDGACGLLFPVVPGLPTENKTHFTQAAYAKQSPNRGGCVGPGNLMDKEKELKRSDNERKHHDAAGFLLRQIRANPGQITLIAIGPLFNVQAAIERDPATFKMLKRVVIMGGSVNRGYDSKGDKNAPPSPEWNIVCDPAGAKALFGAGVPVFVMPLDSTQIHLENPALGTLFAHGSPLTDQLTLLYHQWTSVNEWRAPTLFDPVAVTYSFRPDLCPATPMHLEVDDKGFTKQTPGAPNVQVCLHADEKGFLDLLRTRLAGDQSR